MNGRFSISGIDNYPFICFTLMSIAIVAGCKSTQSTLPDGSTPDLAVYSVQPQVVLPGTWIKVEGAGFVDENSGSLVVQLQGVGQQPWLLSPERLDDSHLKFQIDKTLFSSLGGVGQFQGMLKVRADYPGGLNQSAEVPVSWNMVEQLSPELNYFSAVVGQEVVYLGTSVDAKGTGFLLDGEGRTELRLSGTYTLDDSGDELAIESNLLLLEPASRQQLSGPLAASALGIHPGVFHGQIQAVNVFEGGDEISGTALTDVTMELGPTFITRTEPTEAARGQWVDFFGRGFVSSSATVVIRIEGTFTERDGTVVPLTGDNALQIVPEVVSGEHMRYVLRVSPDGQGGVQGLGAKPGLLRADITPEIYYGTEMEKGFGLKDVEFSILAQKQVIYISYLPGFTDTLRVFGLRNVENLIRERILQVVTRDYSEFSVEFRTVRPDDYMEYAVIEVGGVDPNGRDLLGLDNTMGKDTGNLYFDDIVGGLNADSRENGTYAYGGVFLSSYLLFSPSVEGHMPIASERFDDIFGPFMPSMGGSPVQAGEFPDGDRAEQIELAIHALGSMIGNTISHEMGHTLGLAAGPKDYFHNSPPLPNQIMDGGAERPFEERAEIDGQGPAVWSPENHAYLQKYLPK